MSEVAGASLLEALKRKMQQNRDELEKFRDEAEGKTRILQDEVRSREEAEGLIANLNRKVVVLDNNVEAAEEKLSLIDNKLEISVHASEES